MLEQFGGPQEELAAAMRYFTQALADDDPGRKDMLYDIATEEMSHLEVIGSIVCMLNKGVKGKLAEGVEKEGELFAEIAQGGESHTTSILFGGGTALINWSASVDLDSENRNILQNLVERTASHPESNPKTGAELGSGNGSSRRS